MVRHLLSRTGQAVLVLLAAYTVAFGVLYGLPGDPAALIAAGGDPANSSATPEQVAALSAQYGYDQPLVVQYVRHLGAALTGDLGTSPRTGPVAASIAAAVPATAQIAGLGLLLSVVVGGGLALLATYVQVRWVRQLLLSLPPLGVSVPSFWVGLLLLQGFSFGLGWFPAFGNDGLASLVLPAVTLAVLGSALIAQVFARSLRSEAGEAYADTARAKGASRVRVHLRHTARNASLPTFTITGILVGQFLAGTVVTETVFSRTGLGQLTATAVGTQDIPLALGVVVFGAAVVVVASLLVDLVYPVLDPRMRRARRTVRPGTRAEASPGRSRPMSLVETRPELGSPSPVPAPATRPPSERTRRLLAPGLVISCVWLLLVVVAAFAPGLLAGTDPYAADTSALLQPPSAGHWFGTDQIGRDLFSRVVHGSALSLKATLIAVGVGVCLGAAVGLVAGAAGGWLDAVAMRAVDVLLAIPSLLLSLAIITVLGFGTVNVAIAVGFGSVAGCARIMRSEVLRVRQSVYVEAATSLGVRRHTVLLRHVLPNSAGPVLVLAALDFGTAILAVSSLSFLGYGAKPPTPEWGSLVASGRDFLGSGWWLTTLPGLVVVATVLAANRIARALERSQGGRDS